MSNVAAMEAKLREFAVNKNKVSLSIEEVNKVDQFLVERWGVDLVDTPKRLEEVLGELANTELRTKAVGALADAARTLRQGRAEKVLYEVMADPNLCGLITSKRRHLVLDSIALIAAIVRSLDIQGQLLDVGCHVGIVPDLLQTLVSNHITGLEPVSSAVKVAQSRVSNAEKVQFVEGGIPWITDQRFDVIAAVDSMPLAVGDRGIYLRGISDLLRDGGVAIIVSAHWVEAELQTLRRQLTSSRLGFGFADVVGGYGGMPSSFEAEGVVVLVKGGKIQYPSKIRLEMENNWPAFASFSNSNRPSNREKTQAFHRAQATEIQQ